MERHNRQKQLITVWLALVLVCVFMAGTGWSGNREMVEQRTKELDEINKQAVGEITDLPKDGTVEIKAKAKYKEGTIQFDVYDKKISDTAEGNIDVSGKDGSPAGSVEEGTIDVDLSKDTPDREKQENDSQDN